MQLCQSCPYLIWPFVFGLGVCTNSPHWHGILNVWQDFQRTLYWGWRCSFELTLYEMLPSMILMLCFDDIVMLGLWPLLSVVPLSSVYCLVCFCCVDFRSALLLLVIRVYWKGLWWLTDNCCCPTVLFCELTFWMTNQTCLMAALLSASNLNLHLCVNP